MAGGEYRSRGQAKARVNDQSLSQSQTITLLLLTTAVEFFVISPHFQVSVRKSFSHVCMCV